MRPLPLVLLSLAPACLQARERPNVLFIAVDDLRPTLGCYGDRLAITPNIDALASEGTCFTRAYCQQALSGPTRASMFTGLRPEEVGVTELNTPMRQRNPDVVTLPQAFRENGYRTVGTGKIFHGDVNGADSLSWSVPPSRYRYNRDNEYMLPGNRKSGGKSVSFEFADAPDSLYIDHGTASAAIDSLSRLGDEPFFLAVGFLKPHLPFCAPERFFDLYEKTDFGLASAQRDSIIDAPSISYHNSDELRGYTDIPETGPMTDAQEAALRRAYYSCVSFTDAQVGRLVEALKARGLYENTIIVLWGDHGYHLGERSLWCKSTNYEAACRVPLIVRVPQKYLSGRGAAGKKAGDMVECVDIYPSLLELCGMNSLQPLSGSSFVNVLEGERGGKEYAVSQFPRPYSALHRASARRQMGYAIRDRRFRLVEWYDSSSGEQVATELYRLRGKSPVESRNLSGRRAFKADEERLSSALLDFLPTK
ncbi:MAG: sulfatase [Bacteroidales bacterium]|nr:sulfatase [Bacteroidales bacterium]